MGDSEDEEEPKEAVAEEKAVSDKKPAESKIAEPNQKSASEAKPAGIALPTSEMTFDWMDDDTAMGSIESEEEDESTEKGKTDEQKADVPVVASEKEVKPAAGIALPITEMTDDWMDDDTAMGSMDSEEEEEGPETDKGHV